MPSLRKRLRKAAKIMNMGGLIGGALGAMAGTLLGQSLGKDGGTWFGQSLDPGVPLLESNDRLAYAILSKKIPKEFTDRWTVEFLMWEESQTGNLLEKKG